MGEEVEKSTAEEVDQKTELTVQGWVLRISISLNISLISGLLVWFLTK